MSEENVELAKRLYGHWNAGAESELRDLIHPGFEYTTSGTFPGFDPIYRGHEGFAKFSREMLEAWEYLDLEPRAIEDRGEWLLVDLRFHGKGRESGAEVHLEFHHAAQIRDGLLYRLVARPNRDAALDAAGLPERGYRLPHE
jgi:ketosteroid isomerase-like protein